MSFSLVSLSLANLLARNSGMRSINSFSDALKRISSGSRLIDLKTDPAARAIFNGLMAEDAALGAAMRNAQVGSAFINTASSGVDAASSSLVRLKELSVSAVNGALTDEQREMINTEYQEILGRLDLTTAGAFNFQVGSNPGENVQVSLEDISAAALNLDGTDVSTVSGATSAQAQIDSAIDQLGIFQANLGAQQRGLDLDLQRLETMRTNTQAAMGMISASDIFEDVAKVAQYEASSQAALVAQTRVNQYLGRAITTLFQ